MVKLADGSEQMVILHEGVSNPDSDLTLLSEFQLRSHGCSTAAFRFLLRNFVTSRRREVSALLVQETTRAREPFFLELFLAERVERVVEFLFILFHRFMGRK